MDHIGTLMSADEALQFLSEPAPEPAPPAPETPLAAAAPEPAKKRGRPRKDAGRAETDGEPPLDAPMPPRPEDEKPPAKSAPSASQAWKLDSEMIGYGVSALFGVIATATGHSHWLRTPEQCAPISDPLQRMYSRLPAAKRKELMHYLDPGVLLAGIYQVAGPSLAVEVQLAEARRRGLILPRPPKNGTQPPAGPPSPEPAADPGKVSDLTGVFGGLN